MDIRANTLKYSHRKSNLPSQSKTKWCQAGSCQDQCSGSKSRTFSCTRVGAESLLEYYENKSKLRLIHQWNLLETPLRREPVLVKALLGQSTCFLSTALVSFFAHSSLLCNHFSFLSFTLLPWTAFMWHFCLKYTHSKLKSWSWRKTGGNEAGVTVSRQQGLSVWHIPDQR